MTPQTITLTALPDILLVVLPENHINVEIFAEEKDKCHLAWDLSTNPTELNGMHDAILLPKGNWLIIGLLSEVTEEQAVEMVQHKIWGAETGLYRNYLYHEIQARHIMKETALESLESAILAEGYVFRSAPKPENKDFYWGYLDDLAKWETAQSRVLDRSRCLLLGRSN